MLDEQVALFVDLKLESFLLFVRLYVSVCFLFNEEEIGRESVTGVREMSTPLAYLVLGMASSVKGDTALRISKSISSLDVKWPNSGVEVAAPPSMIGKALWL